MSGEHVIAETLLRSISELNVKSTQRQLNFLNVEKLMSSEEIVDDDSTRYPQQVIGQIKISGVCRVCNSGWMSGIVENAKDDILNLYSGVWNINDLNAYNLARWSLLTSMNIDELYEDNKSIDDETRKKFGQDLDIPRFFYIFLGRKTGAFDRIYAKRTLRRSLSPKDRGDFYSRESATTIILGQAVFHVLQSDGSFDDEVIKEYAQSLGVFPIFPYNSDDFSWRFLPYLRKDDLEKLIDYYFILSSEAGRASARWAIGKMMINQREGLYFRGAHRWL